VDPWLPKSAKARLEDSLSNFLLRPSSSLAGPPEIRSPNPSTFFLGSSQWGLRDEVLSLSPASVVFARAAELQVA
jgi:hypothetical protein